MLVIETERLVLRELTEADFEAAIADCEVGDELTIEYVRYSGSASQTDTTTITIQEYVPDSVTFS